MEVSMIVTYAINGFFALALLVGFLWGVKRGLKKSAYRIVNVAICLIIAFIVAPLLSKVLLTVDFSNLFTVAVDGKDCGTIKQILDAVIAQMAEGSDMVESVPAVKEMINQAPLIILNLLVFVLVFWLLKILTWPIWAIMVRKAYEPKVIAVVENVESTNDSKQNANVQTEQKGQLGSVSSSVQEKGGTKNANISSEAVIGQKVVDKPKKRRWFGGLVGVAQGLIIICVTFIPISGVMSVVKELNSVPANAAAAESNSFRTPKQDESLLQYLLSSSGESSIDPEVLEIIDAINNSALFFVNDTFGANSLIFDNLSSMKIGNKKLVFRDEIKNVNKIYNESKKLFNITDFKFKTVSSIEDFLDNLKVVENLVDYLFNMDMIGIANDNFVPYFVNKAVNETDMDPVLANFLNEYLDSYGTPKYSQLKSDILAVVKVAQAVRDNDLIPAFLEDDIANDSIKVKDDVTFETVEMALRDDPTTNKTPIKDIMDAILSSKTLKTLLASSVNLVIDGLERELSEYAGKAVIIASSDIKESDIDWNKESASVTKLIQTGLKVVGVVDKLNKDTNIESFKDFPFDSLGDMLDTMMNSQIFGTVYQNTLTALNSVDKLTKYTDFNKVKAISWKNELGKIGNIYDALIYTKAVIDDNEITFADYVESDDIGIQGVLKFLDTTVPGVEDANNNKLYQVILDNFLAMQSIQISYEKLYDNLFAKLLKDEFKVTITPIGNGQVNWTNEISNMKTFIKELLNYAPFMVDGEEVVDVDSFLRDGSIVSLGSAIDALKTSTIFGGVVNALCDYVTSERGISKIIDLSCVKVDGFNFENEFTTLQNILAKMRDLNLFDTPANTKITIKIIKDNLFNLTETECMELGQVIGNNALDSKIVFNNIIGLSNQVAEILPFEILKNTSTLAMLTEQKSAEKQRLGNILGNLFIVYKDISGELDTLNYFNYLGKQDAVTNEYINIQRLENVLINLKDSVVLKNTYAGMLSYIGKQDELNQIINFGAVTGNFNWGEEFDAIENIITFLKANPVGDSIWTSLEAGSVDFEALITEKLDTNAANTLYDLVAESKLFSGLKFTVVRQLLDVISGIVGKDYSIMINSITNETVISNAQQANIDELFSISIELASSIIGEFDIDTLNADAFGRFMNELAFNKFADTFDADETHLFEVAYEDLVVYLTTPANNAYASDIENAIRDGDNLTAIEDIETNWVKVFEILPINVMISGLNEVLDLTGADAIEYVPYNTVISVEEQVNIDNIIADVLKLADVTEFDISLNTEDLASLIRHLQFNKFEVLGGGALSGVYDAVINYVVNYETYGSIMEEVARNEVSDHVTDIENISNLRMDEILLGVKYLDEYTREIDDIATATAQEINTLLVNIKNSENDKVEALLKAFINQDVGSIEDKNTINDINFKADYPRVITAILFRMKDIATDLNANATSAVLTLKLVMGDLAVQNGADVDKVVKMFRGITNNTIVNGLIGCNFANEKNKLNSLHNALSSPLTMNSFENMLDALIGTTFTYNTIVANNIVVLDLTNSANLQKLKGTLPLTDAQVKALVVEAIEEKCPIDPQKTNVKKMFKLA